MKIEKLNENQIRCTLTHADLAAPAPQTERAGIWN